MSEQLPISASKPSGTTIAELEVEAAAFIAASRAPSTLRSYRSDWKHFEAWCSQQGAEALPAEPPTVALYLTALARTAKASTIARRLTSISVAHQVAGHPSPTGDVVVRSTWAGIQRVIGTAQVGKAPLLTEDIRAMVAVLPDNLQGDRDACLLLLGFASALRRSELVALDVDDVVVTTDGVVVTVRRSKTDQQAVGRQIGIPYGRSSPQTCPVRRFQGWIESAGFDSGAIFRSIDRHGNLGARLSDRSVALIVKRTAKASGRDPGSFAGHSLRSGMATSAARAGATEAQIMNQTGHRSLATVRHYIKRGTLFHDNAAARLGL